jgi:heme/copper-type cytochrome/quinol oxidase subunit 2
MENFNVFMTVLVNFIAIGCIMLVYFTKKNLATLVVVRHYLSRNHKSEDTSGVTRLRETSPFWTQIPILIYIIN